MLKIRNLQKVYGNYHALDGLDIVPGPEGSDCEAVPEIVQTCVRHTDGGHDLFVVVVKGAGG